MLLSFLSAPERRICSPAACFDRVNQSVGMRRELPRGKVFLADTSGRGARRVPAARGNFAVHYRVREVEF